MAKELTAVAVARAKPRAAAYKLAAGASLSLLVRPDGAKYWRWKYRYGGKEKTLAIGVYPAVSLAEARRSRDQARALHAQGVDPGAQRRVAKAAQVIAGAHTLELVAREWHEVKCSEWAGSHAVKVLGRLEKDVFPALRNRPIGDVTMPECLAVLRKIEARGAIDTARRVRQSLSHIFVYAVATSRCSSNPAADLTGVLRVPEHSRFPTITDPDRIGQLLRAIDVYSGWYSTRATLKLSPLVFVRPTELRLAEWPEFDLAAALWRVPATRMKLRKANKAKATAHLVPLSRQAVAILGDLQLISGRDRYVFPSLARPGEPLSANTVNAALHKMGFKGEIVGHGFRHMASTLLNEQGWEEDAVERQLAHVDGSTRGIYNQAKYLPERRRMMQAWADYLVTLRDAVDVAPVAPARGARGR